MDYQQLMIADVNSISEEQKQFVALHRDIVFCGNSAADFVVKMAIKLKEMRDTKAYESAGFTSFGEYSEVALGIKERQAYTYIQIVKGLSADFLQSTAKFGVTKLALLAKLPSDVRESVVEDVLIEDISVKELKAVIDERSNRIKQLELELDGMREDTDKIIEEAQASVRNEYLQSTAKSEEQEKALRKRITALEQSEQKVKDKLKNVEGELKAEKAASKVTVNEAAKVVVQEDTEKVLALESIIEELKKSVELQASERAKAEKQLAVTKAAAELNYKLKELQVFGKDLLELIGKMEEKTALAAKSAFKAIVERWAL